MDRITAAPWTAAQTRTASALTRFAQRSEAVLFTADELADDGRIDFDAGAAGTGTILADGTLLREGAGVPSAL